MEYEKCINFFINDDLIFNVLDMIFRASIRRWPRAGAKKKPGNHEKNNLEYYVQHYSLI